MTIQPSKTKTAETRAQDAVDVLTRRLAKITAQRSTLEGRAVHLAAEHAAVSKRLEYAKANPDLPEDASHEIRKIPAPLPVPDSATS